MIHAHAAYGLSFHLPFPCPVLPGAAGDTEPDVSVIEGLVPRQLAAPVAEERNWQAEPGRFLWKAGKRAGRFLVESGRTITLQRGPAAEDEMIRFHFLDNVLAAALRQNGLLVLHANSMVTPRGAVAVSGESGAGKSTTLAALIRRGCSMLADDITALRRTQDGLVEAIPGVPQFSLHDDAAGGLALEGMALARHRTQRRKVVVPARSAMAGAAVRLEAIYLLKTYSGKDVRVQSVSGTEKFAALQECIYGPLLPEEHPNLFPIFTALTQQVAVYRMERPANRWTADAVAEVLLHG
jgi:hypothetical protein